METQKYVRVLVVTLAFQGHMNPMLKLSKLLTSKGLHVTLVTTEIAQHLMLKSNTKGPAINLEFFSDGLSEDLDRIKDFENLLKSLKTKGSQNLSNLISKLTKTEGKKFDCIICNAFLPWVPDVAAKHGIPCAMLWIQACALYSIYYHFFKHPKLFPTLENPEETTELPGMPVFKVRDLPSFILPSEPYYLNQLVSEIIESIDKVKWLLVNSFKEFEENIVNSLASTSPQPILPIGPLVSLSMLGKEETIPGNVDMWSAEESCVEWLDKKPLSSVIYISFGSIKVLSQQQIDSVATALQSLNRPFLWVIRPPLKNSVKTCGELPIGFLEETKGRGLVVTWSPQEKVLMHKALACFITHCGWNSSLETIVAGVPVIAYPDQSDQPTVAKLLVDVLKVGVRMRNDDEEGFLSSEEVKRCILEVTDGPGAKEIRTKALELKEAAKKAVAPGGSSDGCIDQFIREISAK